MAATPRDQANPEVERLKSENTRLRSTVSLLSELTGRLTANLDLSTLLQRVVDAACELTNAGYGGLAVFGSAGSTLQFYTHGIADEDRDRIGAPPTGLGLLGLLPDSRQPLRLSDVSNHPQAAGFPNHHPSMKNFLGVSLSHEDEKLGNLYLADKLEGGEFTQDDEALFADQASIAIHNARLYQGVDVERRRMDAILSNSPDGIVFVDGLSGVITANRRAEEMLEWDPGSAKDLASLENRIRVPADATSIDGTSQVEKALRGELVNGEEREITRNDGSCLPVLCSAAPVKDMDDIIIGAVFQFEDLTSVKQSHLELARAEEKYRDIFENAVEGILQSTPDGKYISANPALARILGYDSSEELLSANTGPANQIYVDVSRRAELMRLLLEQETVSGFESQVYRKDGVVIWVSESVRAVRDEAGLVSYLEGTIEDITERKLAEEQVQTEQRRLRVLVDTSPVGVFVVDAATEQMLVVN